MLARPAVREAIVILPHQETFIEATKLGCSLQGLHHNCFRLEEEELAQFLDINSAVTSG